MSTISIESDTNNASTVPSSMTTREIACQTTSDLHIALLALEFPHLFQKLNPLSSVYDTPAQSEIKLNDEISPNIKTPEPSSSECNPHAKYTTVSSVTTSEKKRGEVDFACRSVLYDTLRTPFSGVAVNSSPADISSISSLPSSEKKTPLSADQTSDKRRLSVRLNFQDHVNQRSNNDYVASPILNDEEILCSNDVISCTEDNVALCASIKLAVDENSLPVTTLSNATDKKRSDFSSPSKEIEFTDINEENQDIERVNSKISQNYRDIKEISTMGPDFIPDSLVQIQDDVEIFKDGDACENKNTGGDRSPEVSASVSNALNPYVETTVLILF